MTATFELGTTYITGPVVGSFRDWFGDLILVIHGSDGVEHEIPAECSALLLEGEL